MYFGFHSARFADLAFFEVLEKIVAIRNFLNSAIPVLIRVIEEIPFIRDFPMTRIDAPPLHGNTRISASICLFLRESYVRQLVSKGYFDFPRPWFTEMAFLKF